MTVNMIPEFPPVAQMEKAGLTENSALTDFMDKLMWGTYGRGGKDPLAWKRLCDCDTERLQNILITQRQIPLIYSRAIIAILQERYVLAMVWKNDRQPKARGLFGRLTSWFWRLVDPL